MTKGGKSIWKRIRHHAATVSAWFLVLLAVGVAALWVDSGTATCVSYMRVSRQQNIVRDVHVCSGRQVFLVWYSWVGGSNLDIDYFRTGWEVVRETKNQEIGRDVLRERAKSWAWFAFRRFVFSQARGDMLDGMTYQFVFPHWVLLLLLLSWPAKRGWGWLKLRRRQRNGLCLNCGYDLRASPARCPECGAAREANDETRNSNDERMPKDE
jgi:hypothetical protein